MNPINIITDLVRSILANGNNIYLKFIYKIHKKIQNNRYEVLTNDKTIFNQKIIFASGKNLVHIHRIKIIYQSFDHLY